MSAVIGVAGGCINTGFGIVPLSQLYHRDLKKGLERGRVEVRVRLAAVTANNPSIHLDECERLIKTKACNVLIYQIRPSWWWMLNSAIWVKVADVPGPKVILNCLRQSSEGAWVLDCDGYRGIGKYRLLNKCISYAMNTEKRADLLMRQHLKMLRELSHQYGVQLFILGPLFGSWFEAPFASHSEAYFKSLVSDLNMRLIDVSAIEAKNERLWIGDGAHLSADGHKRLASIILEELSSCL